MIALPVSRPQRGVSLVELMIGMTLGLVIVGAMLVVATNTSRARTELAKTSQQIENGRYAIELMTRSLRHAGFYGDFYTGSFTEPTTTDPCDVTSLATMKDALKYPLHGINNAGSWGTWTCGATLPTCTSTASAAGTCSDILVVRRADSTAICASASVVQNEYYLQADPATIDIQRGLSSSAFNFGVTNATGANSTLCKFVGHPDHACSPALPAAGVTIAANATGAACEGKTAATLYKYAPQVYFVGANNSDSPADGIPTLKRMTLGTAGFSVEPLVEGIENVQVEYGIDSTTDVTSTSFGTPDTYVSAPTAAQWPNVVAVRIHVLARNLETTTGHTDGKTYVLGGVSVGPLNDSYKRHVFSATVALTNLAGRRNLP